MIVIGNALEVLAGMDAESVHCCITSPPYWGLRDYKCPDITFGDGDCEHEWGERLEKTAARTWNQAVGSSTLEGGKTTQYIASQATGQGQFCQLCGAWRG